MKTFLKSALFLITLLIAQQSFAQKAVQSVVIKTPTVQCESCKKRIESNLSRVEGVQKIVVDPKKKTAKITFITDRTNIEYLKTAIANLGYDADDIAANKESYQKLPSCCKKPEDGGGMQQ